MAAHQRGRTQKEMKRKTGNLLGYLSILINLAFWLLVWNPAGWSLQFKSDVAVALIGALSAVLASTIATFVASRWWCISIAASLIMIVLVERALR